MNNIISLVLFKANKIDVLFMIKIIVVSEMIRHENLLFFHMR